jgi:hypothetical protein
MNTNFSDGSSPGLFFPARGATNANDGAHDFGARSNLTEDELKTILRCLELALAVYETRGGHLNAHEISLKSMLSVIRGQVIDQLLNDPPEAVCPGHHGAWSESGSESGPFRPGSSPDYKCALKRWSRFSVLSFPSSRKILVMLGPAFVPDTARRAIP